jgi:hypothetical protein
MSDIEVRMTGDQEASDGVGDGEPLRLEVRSLRDALNEAERLLAGGTS